MKQLRPSPCAAGLAVLLSLAAMLSCTSSPSTATEPDWPADGTSAATAETATPTSGQEAVTAVFDPASVSVELKQTTFFDVRALISGLNSIIQAKDFEAWSSALTQDYLSYYSTAETLANISAAPVLKRQGIVLRSIQDYFIHVVYPSRQNDRVDDVEFIDATHIRAITINLKGERLVLYNLEKIGDTWKIAIWRQS